MSELFRISISPGVLRLKQYLETAQENLGKDLAVAEVRADLLADRRSILKTAYRLEKFNDKWENLFLRLKGPALEEEDGGLGTSGVSSSPSRPNSSISRNRENPCNPSAILLRPSNESVSN
uniref:Uncharacterized protein n=1 Tax=Globodera pallida TaxID=36090 RepID=A0A183C5D6_GLOPA